MNMTMIVICIMHWGVLFVWNVGVWAAGRHQMLIYSFIFCNVFCVAFHCTTRTTASAVTRKIGR